MRAPAGALIILEPLAEAPSPDARQISRRKRLLIALGIAGFAFVLSFIYMSRRNFYGDFYYPWLAARLLLDGRSPYLAIPGTGVYPVVTPFVYPLPTVMAAIPFSWLRLPYAAALFFALSTGLLAYGITRDGYYRLPLFLSAPFISAATQAQWSPLVAAAAVLPSLGFLAILKPNLGLAIAAYRPSRALLAGGILLVLLSLMIMPRWPLEWLQNVSRLPGHYPPLLQPGGIVLLLALLYWRRPEARLLFILACMPQLLFWNDQLPLWLIPRTLRESLFMTMLSTIAYVSWELFLLPGENYGPAAAPYIMALIYLPALLLVVRHARQMPRQGEANAGSVAREAVLQPTEGTEGRA